MSKLKVDTIANSADSASTPIADVINGSARAWVNFNGTGTVAIRAAYNVSSITDGGVGTYTVNFTTALPDTNYVVAQSSEDPANIHRGSAGVGMSTATTSSFGVRTTAGGGAAGGIGDNPSVCLVVFR